MWQKSNLLFDQYLCYVCCITAAQEAVTFKRQTNVL